MLYTVPITLPHMKCMVFWTGVARCVAPREGITCAYGEGAVLVDICTCCSAYCTHSLLFIYFLYEGLSKCTPGKRRCPMKANLGSDILNRRPTTGPQKGSSAYPCGTESCSLTAFGTLHPQHYQRMRHVPQYMQCSIVCICVRKHACSTE